MDVKTIIDRLRRSRHIDGRSEIFGMSIFEVKDNAPHIWRGV